METKNISLIPAEWNVLECLQETERFLDRVYKGSVSLMMSAVTKKQQLSKEKIDELYLNGDDFDQVMGYTRYFTDSGIFLIDLNTSDGCILSVKSMKDMLRIRKKTFSCR